MEGRFVGGRDVAGVAGVAGLRAEAREAGAEGVAAVVVRPGPLGDPVVLAAGLWGAGILGPDVLVGAVVALGRDGRHPAVVARELTGLDHVCGGRSLVACGPPFDDDLAEALALCRMMWREGDAVSEGPAFPVSGARHQPRPLREHGPAVALAVGLAVGLAVAPEHGGGGGGGGEAAVAGMETGAAAVPDAVRELADFVLLPTDDPAVCRMEHA